MVFTPQAACAQKISRRSASALRKLSSTRAKPPLDYNHNLQVADVLEKLPESVTDGRCVLPLCYGEAAPYRTALNCNLVAHGPEPHHTWPGRGPAPLCRRDRLGYLDKLIKSLSRRPAVPYTCASTRKKKRYQRRRNGAPPRGENECPIRGAARMLEPVALRSSMPLSISGKPALPLPCPDTSRIVDHHDVQGIAVIGFGGSTKPQSCG